ncbi:hypothetical protein MASR2M66_09890 [Chloroflexota bacterium]
MNAQLTFQIQIAFGYFPTCSDARKAPYLVLSGEGERLAKELGLVIWSVSLSHTEGQAIAFVVMTE